MLDLSYRDGGLESCGFEKTHVLPGTVPCSQ